MKNPFRKIIFVPLAAALLISCSSREAERGEKVAEINGSPIYMKDLVREVNRASRMEPGIKLTDERMEEILHTMIDKKLLIDEAVKMGLSEDERFLESIKSFWEQTLIRELVDKKNREWADKLFVTDEEVRARHALMQSKITVRYIETHGMKEAQAALSRLSDEGTILGPLFMEDMKPTEPFFGAFARQAGEKEVVAHDDDFYAYEVVKKESAGAPPLESVYEALKASLLEEKKERVLEDWLEARKRGSSIKVNEDAIERLR